MQILIFVFKVRFFRRWPCLPFPLMQKSELQNVHSEYYYQSQHNIWIFFSSIMFNLVIAVCIFGFKGITIKIGLASPSLGPSWLSSQISLEPEWQNVLLCIQHKKPMNVLHIWNPCGHYIVYFFWLKGCSHSGSMWLVLNKSLLIFSLSLGSKSIEVAFFLTQ